MAARGRDGATPDSMSGDGLEMEQTGRHTGRRHFWGSCVNIEIGSYEAKTKLPELLRGVQGGNRYTITLRGEAVADLVPAQGNRLADAALAVDEMRAFMQSRKQLVVLVDLKLLINEGRA